MMFYVGLHQPHDSRNFERAFISINRVRGRKKPVPSADWIMDSGAFTEIATHGHYRHDVDEYGAEIRRLAGINPGMKVAVAQDYMCEPWILEKTGLTVDDHQRLTIERYDALLPLMPVGVYLMPVLQGYRVEDYLRHVELYGDRLAPDAYVGVGSVCKRNGDVRQIEAILTAIKIRHPGFRLHGFGLKTTALGSGIVRECLHSADSMAWSFAARRQGRDANDWREAESFVRRIETMPVQLGWRF
jgi:hypothetical protein